METEHLLFPDHATILCQEPAHATCGLKGAVWGP